MAERHYAEHKGKAFYEELVDAHHVGSDLRHGGRRSVGGQAWCARMMGATNPLEADPGTVRGDFGLSMGQNVVHSADSLESAEREIAIFFPEGGELVV